MIKEFITLWDKRKDELERVFRETDIKEFYNYEDIVRTIFEVCFNEEAIDQYIHYDCEFESFDITKMTKIDDGHYQGTIIFIIPRDTYQPETSDYVMTSVDYGSCSACDTLERILLEDLVEVRVNDLLTLSLHIVQRLKYLD